VFVVTTLAMAACGSEGRPDYDVAGDDGGSAASTGPSSSQQPAGPAIGSDDAGGGGVLTTPGKTTLKGKTYAPNGTLALAGVLVYETNTPPDAIPEQTYCDSCRVLPEGTFVQSAPDGSFELMAHAGTRYLVSEKGQFRRIRKIEVGADGTVQDVAHEVTTLPGMTAAGSNGEGDTSARIAMMDEQSAGDNDAIQQALLALGITEWTSFHDDLSQVNEANLKNFHIALFPCDGTSLNKPGSSERAALRSFVQAGGKVYASDWSHQFVDEPFEEFFEHPNRVWGADTGAQAPAGKYEDVDLKAWLANVSPNEDPDSTHFEGVWSTYLGVHPATVPDTTGGTHLVTPHVYASVTETSGLYYSHEAATSMEFGCGRALLSTFHVDGGNSSNLLMQEKALLYMLLDVSTCIGEPGKGQVN
jgi:hypothetical protein